MDEEDHRRAEEEMNALSARHLQRLRESRKLGNRVTAMLYKALIIGAVVGVVSLVPPQLSPLMRNVRHALLSRTWDVVNVLLVALAVTYGVLGRGGRQNYGEPDAAAAAEIAGNDLYEEKFFDYRSVSGRTDFDSNVDDNEKREVAEVEYLNVREEEREPEPEPEPERVQHFLVRETPVARPVRRMRSSISYQDLREADADDEGDSKLRRAMDDTDEWARRRRRNSRRSEYSAPKAKDVGDSAPKPHGLQDSAAKSEDSPEDSASKSHGYKAVGVSHQSPEKAEVKPSDFHFSDQVKHNVGTYKESRRTVPPRPPPPPPPPPPSTAPPQWDSNPAPYQNRTPLPSPPPFTAPPQWDSNPAAYQNKTPLPSPPPSTAPPQWDSNPAPYQNKTPLPSPLPSTAPPQWDTNPAPCKNRTPLPPPPPSTAPLQWDSNPVPYQNRKPSPSPPPPPPPPPRPPPPLLKQRIGDAPDANKAEKHKKFEKSKSDRKASRNPIPTPPIPPPLPTEIGKHESNRHRRSRSKEDSKHRSARDIVNALGLLPQSERKQKKIPSPPAPSPPAPPPPPSALQQWFSSYKRESKHKSKDSEPSPRHRSDKSSRKVHSSPSPPAPPPPPSAPLYHTDPDYQRKGTSPKTGIPQPPIYYSIQPKYQSNGNAEKNDAPNTRKDEASENSDSSKYRSEIVNGDNNAGQTLKLPERKPFSIPLPPPPPPPFPMFDHQWPSYDEPNVHKGRSSSPADSAEAASEPEAEPERGWAFVFRKQFSLDNGDSQFCPSPSPDEVNQKADAFIARVHEQIRLQKLNSVRERQQA